MKHPHYDLIVQWAQDTSQTVWFYDDWKKTWLMLTVHPAWQPDLKYHIGPTPPKTMRTLGGLEYPAPETEDLIHGVGYYVASLMSPADPCDYVIWEDGSYDYHCLQAGLVHLTKEAAEAHARAILAAIKQANQGE